MSKFNKRTTSKHDTSTYEGALAYDKTLEDEWCNILFSSMLEPTFYESDKYYQNRFIELSKTIIEKYGIEFACKACIFSRHELGMRSISQLLAAIINSYQFEGKKSFYSSYFNRPDDVSEVFCLVDNLEDKKSHGLIRGSSAYLSGLDDYTLGKYAYANLVNKTYNMYDIINITHAHSDSIYKYKKGNLPKPDTIELSFFSGNYKSSKEDMWKDLLVEGRLGYMALIKNIKNILISVDENTIQEYLIPQITNLKAIKKSKIFPYRIFNCWIMIRDICPFSVAVALSKAFDMSIGNVPVLEGSTLLVLDISGSMHDPISNNSKVKILDVGACYCAQIYKHTSNSDIILFGSNAEYVNYTNNVESFNMIKDMKENHSKLGYGTEIKSVFNVINKHYDRIILMSDMQVMNSDRYGQFSLFREEVDPRKLFSEYTKKYGKCHMYSFDLGNYDNQIVETDRDSISYISALNDKVFDFIDMQECGKTLIDIIKDYQ